MHRYIPGVASAWAFCEAGGDVVQIDSLWGLPDGLQFCPHDSFEVDLRIGKVPSKRIRFKPYFIREQLDGSWEYVRVNRKFGRHSSLSDKALIYIAKQTRKISDKIDHNAQIMWFCNIPSSEGLGSHIPWYRTTHFGSRQQQHKRYGRSYDIRSREDLDALATEDHRGLCLRIFPEVSLLRGEDFLDNVIAVARQYDLPVEIAGSMLGHAFYKFQSERLVVYHAEPSRKFDRVRERHIFAKLVRDGIPSHIKSGGEEVVEAKLSAEQIRVALTAKLIEELFELIIAHDRESEEAELVDVLEVVRSLIEHFGFRYGEILKAANQKRKKRGGFRQGKFLVQTSLPKAEQSSFAAQLYSPAVRSIKLGNVRYRKAGIIVPFTALTEKGQGVTAQISERDPDTYVSIEITSEGLRLKLMAPRRSKWNPLSF